MTTVVYECPIEETMFYFFPLGGGSTKKIEEIKKQLRIFDYRGIIKK